jgi:MFS family permease
LLPARPEETIPPFMRGSPAPSTSRSWVTRGVSGILLATFFSDVGHEMVTAILPLYLSTLGLGAAALGAMEGLADLAFSLSKLAGGWVGHHVHRKRSWATGGYLVTALATAGMGLARTVPGLAALRTTAWVGRGFRSPLRDFLLADEVGPEHFGRAYGLERAADMLGAVAGPLVALALVYAGVALQSVILLSLAPALVPVIALLVFVRDRPGEAPSRAAERARLPRSFWIFLAGVFLFGLGDFSRTFLVLIADRALGQTLGGGAMPAAVLLYAVHNTVSAVAAPIAGRLGDRRSKLGVLALGYGLGVVTNLLLAAGSGSVAFVVISVLLSGVYIAIEETLEKAVAAGMLPRGLRSMGFGILAAANSLGDLASSLWVGLWLDAGRAGVAFAGAAVAGFAGLVWMGAVAVTNRRARATDAAQTVNGDH